ILTYLNQRYLSSLFIWGAVSLAQQSWFIPLSLLWKLAVIAIGCAFVMRPLSLLDLGESSSMKPMTPTALVTNAASVTARATKTKRRRT
ncbi:hypothetical protein, partial [Rhizobium leguminosarum]|uniref:hypothetical protein n=1 Tax=Rhizobium leguminosarum TaxID=384 RepID=UPI003F9B9950